MRPLRLILAIIVFAAASPRRPADNTTTFHLSLLGHEIGREIDTLTTNGEVTQLEADFAFDDRRSHIALTGTLEMRGGAPQHLVVKGRTYRLFESDAEVAVSDGRAHVRDGRVEWDVEIGSRQFFPVESFAPLGVQERLIQYWIVHDRPAGIDAPPAGPVRIVSRGRDEIRDANGTRTFERLAIDGPVWGREAAWIDADGRLVAVTTWAGALPFEAVRDGYEAQRDWFIARAVRDRIDDLVSLTTDLAPAASGDFALVGATVIDGTGRAPIPNATVVVRGSRIAAVGLSTRTRVPDGVKIIDVAGMTIVPGLWDMHAHASQIDWAPVYLASGVTTIRDMGGEMAFLTAFRDAIASGRALGPRVLLAGLIDGPGPQSFGSVTAATPAEGIAAVRRYHDARFEQIKVYDLVAPEVVRAVAAEAHRLGMTVTGHVPRGMTPESAIEAGFDQIAHMRLSGAPGSPEAARQIAFYEAHRTAIDPTQSWNELAGRSDATPIQSFLPDLPRLPRPLGRMFAHMPGSDRDPQAVHARRLASLRLLKEAVDAGVPVVAGTDKGVPGFSLPREIELYVEGGMTPLEAIQAATIVPARVMGLARETGSVEPGKRADLVVLAGSPLDRIENIRTARWVVAAGRLYDCAALWRAAGYRAE
ncbi:MAG TPA: amidohydrolase family protein [Vicinamibacterales bacterium]|nr:amidohydrolase family protein [Vicinamibacterales bacterium]